MILFLKKRRFAALAARSFNFYKLIELIDQSVIDEPLFNMCALEKAIREKYVRNTREKPVPR